MGVKVRKRCAKRGVAEVEREIDRLLCSQLGTQALDASRVGARRRSVESWALLMTGLSAPELVRAKRLRDSGRLQRKDLLHLLSVIDQMAATDSDPSACERQTLWDRLGVMRELGETIQTRPIVNSAVATVRPVLQTDVQPSYSYVVQA